MMRTLAALLAALVEVYRDTFTRKRWTACSPSIAR